MTRRSQALVVLNSDEHTHTGRSGYPVLFEYVHHSGGVRMLTANRKTGGPIRRAGRKLLRVKSASHWYDISSLKMEWQTRKFTNSIIHLAWADRDWGFCHSFAARRSNLLVGTFHACPDDFESIVVRPELLRHFDAVILMSNVQKQNFVDAGVDEDRIHVVLHGIDTEHFRPGQAKKCAGEERGVFRVLHVGSYRRDFDALYGVCRELRGRKEFEFRIRASEAHGHRFEEFENVVLLPRLSDEELLDEYQNADCLLMTAKAATANNAILEGMACGLPVVTQDVGGIPEYTGSKAAFLGKPGSAEDLVQALLSLISNPQKRREMALAARCRAEQLSWDNVARKMLAIYEFATLNQGRDRT